MPLLRFAGHLVRQLTHRRSLAWKQEGPSPAPTRTRTRTPAPALTPTPTPTPNQERAYRALLRGIFVVFEQLQVSCARCRERGC